MFINPIENGYWTSKFGLRTHPVTGKKSSMHSGIDIARQPNTNVQVLAAADGEVIRMGALGTYGNVIMIRHKINGKTFETNYAHLTNDSVNAKTRKVKVGDKVKQGQVIGIMGNTGSSTAPHLHFEIHEGLWATNQPNAVDPEKYIKFYSKKEITVMQQQIKALNDKVAALEKLIKEALVNQKEPEETEEEIANKKKVSDWAKHSADWAKKNGITDGTRPKDLITREEVWVTVERAHKVK